VLFTGMLATKLPNDVADVTLAELLDDLPEEVAKRPNEGMLIPQTVGIHDWQSLSLREPQGFYPVSPLREPFHSLLRLANPQALDLIRAVSNHAIMSWRQLHKFDWQRRATPLPLVIEFPWGSQEFYGDHQVYSWSRGHGGSNALESAMMALDEWAFEQLEAGINVDQLIQTIVTGHQSVAVLAIAVALAIAANRASATIVALAAAQRLWAYDILRSGQDGPSQANLIGFMNQNDLPHYRAVKKGNERPARTMNIQWLAQIAMLNHEPSVREKIQDAVKAFPTSLPFEYEEQKGNEKYVDDLRRQAEYWAILGEPRNYHADENPTGDGYIVTIKDPNEADPDVVEARQQSQRLIGRLTLLNWAEKSQRESKLADGPTPEAALIAARAIDHKDLFKAVDPPHEAWLDRGAVAGTAAMILVYVKPGVASDVKWAAAVTLRAAQAPERSDGHGFGPQIPLYHPAGYAITALGAMVRDDIEAEKAKSALLDLVAHPQEEIAATALREGIACWDADPEFAWSALNLGILKSIGIHANAKISAYGCDFTLSPREASHLVSKAKRFAKSRRTRFQLEAIPEAWASFKTRPKPSVAIRRIYTDTATGVFWQEPERFLRWDFLPRVLRQVPVDKIMGDSERRAAFLKFAYSLLKWTIRRLIPPWQISDKDRRDKPGRELYAWQRVLMRLLADVALIQDVDETDRHILTPIFALEDEHASALLEPFVNLLTCKGILDPQKISPHAPPLLEMCMRRVLASHDWEGARLRNGDIFGNHILPMINDFLMVSVDKADLSSRFANGDWHEIKFMMTIIDPFIRAVGDVPSVTFAFLKLCERAKAHYPADMFVEQVEGFLSHQEGTPVGWRASSITGRLAALIQSFAEAAHPLSPDLGQGMLRILDRLVDMGDRRSAALQSSEYFRSVRS
jgi:hypothetical protein